MSRFGIFSVFVIVCAIQVVLAEYEAESHLHGTQEVEIPNLTLSRVERSSRSRDAKKARQLRKTTRATKSPCSCSGDTCNCCAKFNIEGRKSGDEGCASFKIPDGKTRNQLVRYNFNFDNQVTNAAAAYGRDPKGMCQPFPGYSGSEVCSRFHSTQVENGKVRFCLTMEAKYAGYVFYKMDFDCVTYDVANQQQVGTK